MSRNRDDLYLRTKTPQRSQPLTNRETRTTSTRPKRYRPTSQSRRKSAIIGGILLLAGIMWIGWLVLHAQSQSVLSTFSIPGLAPLPTAQVSPLVTAGITLGQPTLPPALSRQQVLQIASQLEPNAASNAKSTSAQYVLLNYASTSAAHADLHNVPAWMVLYQNIPQATGDTSADPTSAATAHHDLYVFLDDTTGKELLAISV